MVTLIKYGALSGGEKYNVNVLNLDGLSTDTKPTRTYIEYGSDGREVGRMGIPNGSIFTEIDTGNTYMYDVDATTWHKVSIGGGGGGTQGGIVLVGETTTALTDNATTNPITVDGQSYTAQPNDAVIYGSKEFLFDGTKWHEFGDLSGLVSKDIGAMTGYAKASTGSAIVTTDTLNQAIGKVEKRTEVNENNILSDNIISTSFTWSNGYVSTGGYIFSSTQSYFSQPFTLHAGEKIVVRTKNKNICIIGTTTADSIAVGDSISVLRITSGIDQEETYDYTATEDIKIVICVLVSNYVAYVANHNTDLLLGSYATAAIKQNEDNISTEQSKTTGMSAGGSDYITVNGIRVYVSATQPTGARTGDLWIGG